MSGPRRRKPRHRKTGLRRREFLKRAGAATMGIAAVPLMQACSSDDDVAGPPPPLSAGVKFLHGVASGDPLADRVILWTRATPAVPGETVTVRYEVATNPALTNIVHAGETQTSASRDYTVKVDVPGLSPGTTYYYRFKGADSQSAVARTRTLPVGTVARLRIGVLSCASFAHGLFNATRRVAERSDLDLVLFLGDYIYEYSSDGANGKETYGDFRTYDPPGEILSLDDYRRRHAQYKTDADLQELHRQHAVIPIWDDHETADNSWKDGAVNHNENGDEGDWQTRVGVALKAYYEWMPVREPAQAKNFFRSFRLGDLAEIVLIEERLIARDEQVAGVASIGGAAVGFVPLPPLQTNDRDLLGPEQEAWLKNTLRASPARWKLLGHGVMLSQFKLTGLPGTLPGSVYINPDQWDGYPNARERLYDVLEGRDGGAAVGNVVSLAADIHCSWSNDLARDPNNPLVYNPLTGSGALAVEFVATSVTAPGLEQLAQLQSLVPVMNPQVQHVDFSQRGYLLLDLTPQRVVGEHWFVPTITAASSEQSLGAAHEVLDGNPHLLSTAATDAQPAPPRAP